MLTLFTIMVLLVGAGEPLPRATTIQDMIEPGMPMGSLMNPAALQPEDVERWGKMLHVNEQEMMHLNQQYVQYVSRHNQLMEIDGKAYLQTCSELGGLIRTDRLTSPAVLQATRDLHAQARRQFDPAMREVVQSLMEAMYQDAVLPNGTVDLAKVKTWHEIQEFRFPPNPPADHLGSRLHKLDLHNHHTVPKEWAMVLYENAHGPGAVPPNGWDAWLNDMPGILLDRVDHVGGKGTASFHEILQTKLPNGVTNSATILEKIEESYDDWNTEFGPKIWTVAQQWLQNEGLLP